jgi:hypothetical protein
MNAEIYHPNPSGEGTGAARLPVLFLRTIVYVDGFNFYNRTVNHTPYKWLDIKSLCEKLLKPQNKIVGIKYFTSRVTARPNDPGQPTRQDVYFRALKAHIPNLEFYWGNFQSHEVKGWISPNAGKGWVYIIKTEEKGSDVNLAVHLLNDAWHDRYDCALLISNDSDLYESAFIAKTEKKKMIGWLITDIDRPCRKLMSIANFKKEIREDVLIKSQLPDLIPGTNIRKPVEWDAANYIKINGVWKNKR